MLGIAADVAAAVLWGRNVYTGCPRASLTKRTCWLFASVRSSTRTYEPRTAPVAQSTWASPVSPQRVSTAWTVDAVTPSSLAIPTGSRRAFTGRGRSDGRPAAGWGSGTGAASTAGPPMRPATRPRSGRPTASLSARRPGAVNDPGDRDTIVDDEPGGFQGCSGGQGSRPRPSRAITGSPGASRPGATAAHDGHGVVAPGHEQRFFVGPQCHRPRDDVHGRSPRLGVRSGAASACPTRRSRW